MDFFADACEGNAFAGIQFSSGFIEASEHGIATGTFDFARQANQVADFSNFLTSFVRPRISPSGDV